MGLGPAVYGVLFYLFHVDLGEKATPQRMNGSNNDLPIKIDNIIKVRTYVTTYTNLFYSIDLCTLHFSPYKKIMLAYMVHHSYLELPWCSWPFGLPWRLKMISHQRIIRGMRRKQQFQRRVLMENCTMGRLGTGIIVIQKILYQQTN